MILADTSVWADHFRKADTAILDQMAAGMLAIHPMVIGEIALGYLKRRPFTLAMLRSLPRMRQVNELQLLDLIEQRGLAGRGVGLVDVNLLASVELAGDALLWTRDKRLRAVAGEMDILADLD